MRGSWPDRQVVGREALRQRVTQRLRTVGDSPTPNDTPRNFLGGGEVPIERLRRGLPRAVAGMFTAEQLGEMLDMTAEQRVKALADAWGRLALAEGGAGHEPANKSFVASERSLSVGDHRAKQWVKAASTDGVRVTPTLVAAARAVAPALNRVVTPGGVRPHAGYGRGTLATGTGDVPAPSARQAAVVQAVHESVPTEPVDTVEQQGSGTTRPVPSRLLSLDTATILTLPQVCCGDTLDDGCAAAPCAVGQVSAAAAAVALAARPAALPDVTSNVMSDRWRAMPALAAQLGPIAKCHFGLCSGACFCDHRHPLARALMGVTVRENELNGARLHLTTPNGSLAIASALLERVCDSGQVERLAVEFVKAADGPVVTSLVVVSANGRSDKLLTLVAEAVAHGSMAMPRTVVTFGKGDDTPTDTSPRAVHDAYVYSGERGYKLGLLSRAVWLESDADVHWMPRSNSLKVTLQCWDSRGGCRPMSATIGPTRWYPHVGNSSWDVLGAGVYRRWFGLSEGSGRCGRLVCHRLSYGPSSEAEQLGGLLAHSGCGVHVSDGGDAATVAVVHPSLQVAYIHITLGSPISESLAQAAAAFDRLTQQRGTARGVVPPPG